jgi:hypothetical protein
MSEIVTARVADELAAWVKSYAVERGVPKGAVVEAALREFKVLAARGVPDLQAPTPAKVPEGESAFSRMAREQAELAHSETGVGSCPESGSGHEWGMRDGNSVCVHCGASGREFLAAASAQRVELFSRIGTPQSIKAPKAKGKAS